MQCNEGPPDHVNITGHDEHASGDDLACKSSVTMPPTPPRFSVFSNSHARRYSPRTSSLAWRKHVANKRRVVPQNLMSRSVRRGTWISDARELFPCLYQINTPLFLRYMTSSTISHPVPVFPSLAQAQQILTTTSGPDAYNTQDKEDTRRARSPAIANTNAGTEDDELVPISCG